MLPRSFASSMERQSIPINLNIANSRSMPGMIERHTTNLQSTPCVLKTIDSQGANNSSKQFPGIIIGKGEPVALARLRIVVLHGISQTTNATHDGYATVTHRDQLTGATGFKTRRHQEHIATGIDAPG